jgi:hypothetical protein
VWRRELDSADPRWAGPGTATPAEVTGGSEVRLTLAPLSAAVYTLRRELVTHR